VLYGLSIKKPTVTGKLYASLLIDDKKLTYKAIAQGKHIVEIDTFYPSSKTCHACGHKVDSMSLSIRTWDCPSCGIKGIDRDINAALNIKQQGIVKLKAAGLTVSANGGLRQSAVSAVAA